MQVSQFEIYRLVQRAMEALGAGYGVDRDAARAVAWLEARGLPGLAAFAGELPGLERGMPVTKLERGAAGEIRIDAGDGSAIAFAGAAMDLVVGQARRDGSARLSCRCRSPLFLIPAAVETAGDLSVDLAWPDGEGGVRAIVGPGAALSLFMRAERKADAGLLNQPAGEVVITVSSNPLRPPAGLVVALDGNALARRLTQSLDKGIAAEDPLWRRLDAVAARVQVPPSEESRKGAGGGDANA
jgi:hypothetical protein